MSSSSSQYVQAHPVQSPIKQQHGDEGASLFASPDKPDPQTPCRPTGSAPDNSNQDQNSLRSSYPVLRVEPFVFSPALRASVGQLGFGNMLGQKAPTATNASTTRIPGEPGSSSSAVNRKENANEINSTKGPETVPNVHRTGLALGLAMPKLDFNPPKWKPGQFGLGKATNPLQKEKSKTMETSTAAVPQTPVTGKVTPVTGPVAAPASGSKPLESDVPAPTTVVTTDANVNTFEKVTKDQEKDSVSVAKKDETQLKNVDLNFTVKSETPQCSLPSSVEVEEPSVDIADSPSVVSLAVDARACETIQAPSVECQSGEKFSENMLSAAEPVDNTPQLLERTPRSDKGAAMLIDAMSPPVPPSESLKCEKLRQTEKREMSANSSSGSKDAIKSGSLDEPQESGWNFRILTDGRDIENMTYIEILSNLVRTLEDWHSLANWRPKKKLKKRCEDHGGQDTNAVMQDLLFSGADNSINACLLAEELLPEGSDLNMGSLVSVNTGTLDATSENALEPNSAVEFSSSETSDNAAVQELRLVANFADSDAPEFGPLESDSECPALQPKPLPNLAAKVVNLMNNSSTKNEKSNSSIGRKNKTKEILQSDSAWHKKPFGQGSAVPVHDGPMTAEPANSLGKAAPLDFFQYDSATSELGPELGNRMCASVIRALCVIVTKLDTDWCLRSYVHETDLLTHLVQVLQAQAAVVEAFMTFHVVDDLGEGVALDIHKEYCCSSSSSKEEVSDAPHLTTVFPSKMCDEESKSSFSSKGEDPFYSPPKPLSECLRDLPVSQLVKDIVFGNKELGVKEYGSSNRGIMYKSKYMHVLGLVETILYFLREFMCPLIAYADVSSLAGKFLADLFQVHKPANSDRCFVSVLEVLSQYTTATRCDRVDEVKMCKFIDHVFLSQKKLVDGRIGMDSTRPSISLFLFLNDLNDTDNASASDGSQVETGLKRNLVSRMQESQEVAMECWTRISLTANLFQLDLLDRGPITFTTPKAGNVASLFHNAPNTGMTARRDPMLLGLDVLLERDGALPQRIQRPNLFGAPPGLAPPGGDNPASLEELLREGIQWNLPDGTEVFEGQGFLRTRPFTDPPPQFQGPFGDSSDSSAEQRREDSASGAPFGGSESRFQSVNASSETSRAEVSADNSGTIAEATSSSSSTNIAGPETTSAVNNDNNEGNQSRSSGPRRPRATSSNLVDSLYLSPDIGPNTQNPFPPLGATFVRETTPNLAQGAGDSRPPPRMLVPNVHTLPRSPTGRQLPPVPSGPTESQIQSDSAVNETINDRTRRASRPLRRNNATGFSPPPGDSAEAIAEATRNEIRGVVQRWMVRSVENVGTEGTRRVSTVTNRSGNDESQTRPNHASVSDSLRATPARVRRSLSRYHSVESGPSLRNEGTRNTVVRDSVTETPGIARVSTGTNMPDIPPVAPRLGPTDTPSGSVMQGLQLSSGAINNGTNTNHTPGTAGRLARTRQMRDRLTHFAELITRAVESDTVSPPVNVGIFGGVHNAGQMTMGELRRVANEQADNPRPELADAPALLRELQSILDGQQGDVQAAQQRWQDRMAGHDALRARAAEGLFSAGFGGPTLPRAEDLFPPTVFARAGADNPNRRDPNRQLEMFNNIMNIVGNGEDAARNQESRASYYNEMRFGIFAKCLKVRALDGAAESLRLAIEDWQWREKKDTPKLAQDPLEVMLVASRLMSFLTSPRLIYSDRQNMMNALAKAIDGSETGYNSGRPPLKKDDLQHVIFGALNRLHNWELPGHLQQIGRRGGAEKYNTAASDADLEHSELKRERKLLQERAAECWMLLVETLGNFCTEVGATALPQKGTLEPSEASLGLLRLMIQILQGCGSGGKLQDACSARRFLHQLGPRCGKQVGHFAASLLVEYLRNSQLLPNTTQTDGPKRVTADSRPAGRLKPDPALSCLLDHSSGGANWADFAIVAGVKNAECEQFQEKTFMVHKSIMYAYVPFFRRMFGNSWMDDGVDLAIVNAGKTVPESCQKDEKKNKNNSTLFAPASPGAPTNVQTRRNHGIRLLQARTSMVSVGSDGNPMESPKPPGLEPVTDSLKEDGLSQQEQDLTLDIAEQSASSDPGYLENCSGEKKLNEFRQQNVMYLRNVPPCAVEAWIKYCYTFNAELIDSIDKAIQLMSLADEFGQTLLLCDCETYLFDHMTSENVDEFLGACLKWNAHNLKQIATEFALKMLPDKFSRNLVGVWWLRGHSMLFNHVKSLSRCFVREDAVSDRSEDASNISDSCTEPRGSALSRALEEGIGRTSATESNRNSRHEGARNSRRRQRRREGLNVLQPTSVDTSASPCAAQIGKKKKPFVSEVDWTKFGDFTYWNEKKVAESMANESTRLSYTAFVDDSRVDSENDAGLRNHEANGIILGEQYTLHEEELLPGEPSVWEDSSPMNSTKSSILGAQADEDDSDVRALFKEMGSDDLCYRQCEDDHMDESVSDGSVEEDNWLESDDEWDSREISFSVEIPHLDVLIERANQIIDLGYTPPSFAEGSIESANGTRNPEIPDFLNEV